MHLLQNFYISMLLFQYLYFNAFVTIFYVNAFVSILLFLYFIFSIKLFIIMTYTDFGLYESFSFRVLLLKIKP